MHLARLDYLHQLHQLFTYHYLTWKKPAFHKKGSRINYKSFFKFGKNVEIEKVVDKVKPRLEKEGLNYDTVESQKEDTNRSLRDLTQFLAPLNSNGTITFSKAVSVGNN